MTTLAAHKLVSAGDSTWSGGDPVSWVTVALVFVFGWPQRYVVQAFGAVGSPAALVALMAAAWWFVGIASGRTPSVGVPSARRLILPFWASGLVGFAAAWSRSLTVTEGHAADRALLQWIGYGGLALLVADGVGSRARLDTLVRRLVDAATVLAMTGILQHTSGFDLSRLWALPLHWNGDQPAGGQVFRRGGLLRIAATTLHPIEFGVVLAALLPLAMAQAVSGRERPSWRRWSPPLLIGSAIPLALSRAAIIGLVVGLVWLLGGLAPAARFRLGVIGAAAGSLSLLGWPRAVDALRTAFSSVGTDPSIAARTSDYRYFDRFVAERPLAGRGIGTFVPKLYDYLDNQYLLTVIEGGVIALLALVSLLLGAMWLARRTARDAADSSTALLARALGASVAVHAVTFATYDGLAFPTASFSLFVVIGCLGALGRLSLPEQPS